MDRLRLQFQNFVDTYINDEAFRNEFDSNRVEAVRRMGYTITPEIEKALADLDLHSLRELAIAMGGPTLT
jgi:hypothetical protein